MRRGLGAFGRRNCKETALSNWRISMPDELIDIIVEFTNDRARHMNSTFVVTRQMIYEYIGVTILIGVYTGKGEPVRATWSESEGRKCISQFMSRNVFEQITACLQYDLTGNREIRRQKSTFAPLGAVYDMWEQRLALPFIPHEYVTVDETLVPFRGRCILLSFHFTGDSSRRQLYYS